MVVFMVVGLSIQSLRVFLSILEHGSLSAAGRDLGMTQPAVSNHLHALEERFGVTLLMRGRRLQPMPAGECLAGHARRVLEDLAILEAEVARHAGPRGRGGAGLRRRHTSGGHGARGQRRRGGGGRGGRGHRGCTRAYGRSTIGGENTQGSGTHLSAAFRARNRAQPATLSGRRGLRRDLHRNDSYRNGMPMIQRLSASGLLLSSTLPSQAFVETCVKERGNPRSTGF